MAGISYKASALWSIGRQLQKPRLSGLVFNDLKQLGILKPFRGTKAGVYKQRNIRVLTLNDKQTTSLSRGMGSYG